MAKSSKGRTDHNEVLALARRSLSGYAPLIYPHFDVARHHSKLIAKLEAVERGEIKRLMVFMPPRHGKSLLSTQIFPAFFLGRNPGRSIITATYSQDLSDDFGRNVRNFVNDPYTHAVFPELQIAEDSNSMKRFMTSAGGAYYAVGRGAAITGRGADLLLIDDPIKDMEEARSETSDARLKTGTRALPSPACNPEALSFSFRRAGIMTTSPAGYSESVPRKTGKCSICRQSQRQTETAGKKAKRSGRSSTRSRRSKVSGLASAVRLGLLSISSVPQPRRAKSSRENGGSVIPSFRSSVALSRAGTLPSKQAPSTIFQSVRHGERRRRDITCFMPGGAALSFHSSRGRSRRWLQSGNHLQFSSKTRRQAKA